jgi:hypothetical protein
LEWRWNCVSKKARLNHSTILDHPSCSLEDPLGRADPIIHVAAFLYVLSGRKFQRLFGAAHFQNILDQRLGVHGHHSAARGVFEEFDQGTAFDITISVNQRGNADFQCDPESFHTLINKASMLLSNLAVSCIIL